MLHLAGGSAQPTEGTGEVGASVHGVGKGGCRCLDLRNNLHGGCPGGPVVWVGDVGDDTMHWEVFGLIPPQGGLQADRAATSEEEGREVGVSLAGRRDEGGGVKGGGDLVLLPLEQSCTVHGDQAHYGPVSNRRDASGFTGGQTVVGAGRLGLGGDVDGGKGGGMGGRGGGDGRYGDGYRKLIRWEGIVANANFRDGA